MASTAAGAVGLAGEEDGRVALGAGAVLEAASRVVLEILVSVFFLLLCVNFGL